MERHRIRWDRRGWSALAGLLLLACCVGSAQAAGMDAVIGTSPGAMSPRATVRSYGARVLVFRISELFLALTTPFLFKPSLLQDRGCEPQLTCCWGE